jgi:hypothetical protein
MVTFNPGAEGMVAATGINISVCPGFKKFITCKPSYKPEGP